MKGEGVISGSNIETPSSSPSHYVVEQKMLTATAEGLFKAKGSLLGMKPKLPAARHVEKPCWRGRVFVYIVCVCVCVGGTDVSCFKRICTGCR